MVTLEEQELLNPDYFARTLQDLLVSEGPRSREVRRLRRLAHRERQPQLQKILESKISAYYRHQRESRVPTLWNLPIRALDWLWDDARFVPPRDVLMTLVYVVVALVFVEAIKRYGLPNYGGAEVPQPGSVIPSISQQDSLARIEELIDSLNTPADQQELESIITEKVDRLLDEVLSSPEFRERLQTRLLEPHIAENHANESKSQK